MVACSAEDASIREYVVARRKSSEAALARRFEKAKADGDLPEGVEPVAMASCVTTVLQGLSVKAQGGASREELENTVSTFLALWPSR
jgi:hypothetical protein